MNYYNTSRPYLPFNQDIMANHYGFEFLSILIPVLIFMLFVLVVFAVATYVFTALGLYTMAKKRNLSRPWMAFIPALDLYLKGELINDDVSIGSWHIPYAKLFLPLLPLALGLVFFFIGYFPSFGVSFIVILLSLAIAFYQYAALFWLFSLYTPEHKIAFLILSIFFPFLGGIFIFAIRNKEAFDPRYPEGSPKETYDSKSILSLCFGISSFFTGIFYTSVVGIIISTTTLKEQKALGKPHGVALAGLICSIANIVFKIILGILLLFLLVFSASAAGFYY